MHRRTCLSPLFAPRGSRRHRAGHHGTGARESSRRRQRTGARPSSHRGPRWRLPRLAWESNTAAACGGAAAASAAQLHGPRGRIAARRRVGHGHGRGERGQIQQTCDQLIHVWMNLRPEQSLRTNDTLFKFRDRYNTPLQV